MRFTLKRVRATTPEEKAIVARVRAAHSKVKSAAYMQKLIAAELYRPAMEARRQQQQQQRALAREKAQEEARRKAEAAAEQAAVARRKAEAEAKQAAIAERERRLAFCNDPVQRHTRSSYRAAHNGPLVRPVFLFA